MRIANLSKLISLLGLVLLYFSGCSAENSNDNDPSAASLESAPEKQLPDLSEAVEKRFEGKTSEAIKILRDFNGKFPDSHAILIQLARALHESNQYALASFRFDQAISAGAPEQALKEAAVSYSLAGDYESSAKRYADYLVLEDDPKTWVQYGRTLAKIKKTTDAINAFSKGANLLTYEDRLLMGNLFAAKKLLPQAQYWYEEASKANKADADPLLKILQIKLNSGDEDKAESLIFDLEKVNPGIIDKTDLADASANLLRRTKLGVFIRKGISPSGLSVSQLVSGLTKSTNAQPKKVTSAGPKLPPTRPLLEPYPDIETKSNEALPAPPALISSAAENQSLANVFSSPPIDVSPEPVISNVENARISYLDRRYQDTLSSARAALKENPKNAEAWKLCSQAHFQIGETQEAEMTILEAIRHDPVSLDIRMDYLRIARETLSSNRYLAELEKARDIFPESSDLVWELARRYHLVERMPVTAGILYRKVLELEPEGSGLANQAEMELLKLRE